MPCSRQVVPIYCFDPRHYGNSPWGVKRTGDYRAKFLIESVNDLKHNLQQIGSDLLIHMGYPEEAIPGMHLPLLLHTLHGRHYTLRSPPSCIGKATFIELRTCCTPRAVHDVRQSKQPRVPMLLAASTLWSLHASCIVDFHSLQICLVPTF